MYIISQHKLLHTHVSRYDREFWGRFSITEEDAQFNLQFIQKRKLSASTAAIFKAVGYRAYPSDLYISTDEGFKAESSLDGYRMPANPNNPTDDDRIIISEMAEKVPYSSPVMCFLSLFRFAIQALPKLYTIEKELGTPPEFFPYIIEAFTLPNTPSFTRCHNAIENLGDGILSVSIMRRLINSMGEHPNHYLAHRFYLIISNKVYGEIFTQMDMSSGVIGNIDYDKVGGDCIEAIAGGLALKLGFDKADEFFHSAIFNLSQEYLISTRLSKTMNAIKLNTKIDPPRDDLACEIPPYATPFISTPVFPMQYAFKQSELQTKLKMLGKMTIIAVLRLYLVKRRKEDDLRNVKFMIKRDVCTKVGFPSRISLFAFVGSISIANGVDASLNFVNNNLLRFFISSD